MLNCLKIKEIRHICLDTTQTHFLPFYRRVLFQNIFFLKRVLCFWTHESNKVVSVKRNKESRVTAWVLNCLPGNLSLTTRNVLLNSISFIPNILYEVTLKSWYTHVLTGVYACVCMYSHTQFMRSSPGFNLVCTFSSSLTYFIFGMLFYHKSITFLLYKSWKEAGKKFTHNFIS